MRVVAILLPKEDDLRFVAESCLRWSPQVALGQEAVFVEIGKCAKVYKEESLLSQLNNFLEEFSLPARVSIADDIPTSLAKARFGFLSKEDLPVEALADFVSPFEKNKSLDSMISSFVKLGLRKLTDLRSLRPQEISSRFGKQGLFAATRVQDAKHIPWPIFRPDEVLEENCELSCDQCVKNLEPLLFLLKGMLDRLLARLNGRGERVTKLVVALEQEKYSTIKRTKRYYEIEFTMPMNSPSDLLSIIKERLDREFQLNPLGSPVISINLLAEERQACIAPQKDFFDKREEQKEALATLVSRLCQKLGDERSFWAQPVSNYRPENTWVRTLSAPKESYMPFPKRPLRLFRKPQSLSRRGQALVSKDKRWRVQSFIGPENLSGEWWGDHFDRDYYKVKTHGGEQLWIFKENNKLFLHGIFD